MFLFAKLLKNADQDVRSLAKKFGSLCMLWIGSTPVLVINSLKETKEILEKARLD
jgi:hypothetical protein